VSPQTPDLKSLFPQLNSNNYRITSPVDGGYNCIAYAANDTTRWWWPTEKPVGGIYWPPTAPREETLEAFISAFEELGYSPCPDGTLESKVEKIVLYVKRDGTPTHAARQLSSGEWASKLGENVDIEHSDPEAVGGDEKRGYGRVAIYMARPVEDS
jgi:hypothetical protein